MSAAPLPADTRSSELFGHPTCLFTLFFAEMWERFSFYGMKALLILYMVNYLFWRQGEASSVMAWYAGAVYATPILGGIIADRFTGARWAVVIGGVIIAIGHFLLAFEPLSFFYSGLAFIVVGTGFLKPNISTQVGALYRSDDERRDSAFTIFYMGINIGAFIGPLICGWLRIHYGYHYGFAAAGVGMVLGLIVYILGMQSVVRREGEIADYERSRKANSDDPVSEDADEAKSDAAAAPLPAKSAAVPAKVYFDRSLVLVVICIFAILFWVGFEQAANVMNLWADKHTNLHVFQSAAPEVVIPGDPATGAAAPPTSNDFVMSAEMTQSINPLFIIVFAAVFAWLWEWLDRRGKQPSTPFKMALGVFFLTCAYGIMLLAASAEGRQTSTNLATLPGGLNVDAETAAVFTMEGETDEESERVYFGATRLRWEDGTLKMRGVLTDIDWMRALGASSPASYQQAIATLNERAEERADEVRQQKAAGDLEADAQWSVSVQIPAEVGALNFIAGLPTTEEDDEEVAVATWNADARELTISATLSQKDKAQLLAGGADPEFLRALTEIYRASSVLKISILWLFAFYLVLTIGELCISPVGLSLVTKAAPPKLVGLFMGFWFFTTGAVSNFLAHYAGGYWGTMTPGEYFIIFGMLGAAATVIMLVLLRVLKPRLHGIH